MVSNKQENFKPETPCIIDGSTAESLQTVYNRVQLVKSPLRKSCRLRCSPHSVRLFVKQHRKTCTTFSHVTIIPLPGRHFHFTISNDDSSIKSGQMAMGLMGRKWIETVLPRSALEQEISIVPKPQSANDPMITSVDIQAEYIRKQEFVERTSFFSI